MRLNPYALMIALCLGSALLAQENAQPPSGDPVVVPTPTFGPDSQPPAPTGDAPSEAAPPADAPALPPESAIPQTYRDDRYAVTKGKNPFLLKTGGQTVVTTENFGKDWELKGLREYKGVVKASIQNRQTQQYRNIGPEPDSEGFKVVNAKIGRNRKDSSVEVAKGAETATLTYSDAPSAGGRPMAGGVVPGQQPVPRGAQAGMPQGFRPGTQGAQQQGGNGMRAPVIQQNGVNVPNGAQPGYGVPPPGVVPGSTNQATPNPVNRRRVLIPAPVPPTAPVP